jgi:SAM-dependent methyltransferase
MPIWNAVRHLLPRRLKDEAKERVAKAARETLQPLQARAEELERSLGLRLEALRGEARDRDAHWQARDRDAESRDGGLAARMDGLGKEIRQLHTAIEQMLAIFRHEDPGLLPPPRHLQVRVVGDYVPGFIESGFSICEDLNAVLRVAGKTLTDFPRILDFGCGCGRTTRALKTLLPACEVHGTDIDAEAIAWLEKHYGRFGEFRLAPHDPPTTYATGSFDLVIGISVFTHLPEDMQFAWLRELARITRPGGYLILTTSGEASYRELSADARRIMDAKGFYYVGDGGYGQSISLPDFYQNSFHSHDYIRREWSRHFEVVDIQTRRMQTYQDTILLRARAERPSTPPRSSS